MTRARSVEAVVAVAFAAVILAAGGATLYFLGTQSVHSDPAAVASSSFGPPAEGYGGAVEEVRRLARSLMVKENLPGLSVAVAHNGRVVWDEGFGWADVDRRVPVTPQTRFRVGAVSMPITAAAVGLLHQRGRIDLDAPVQRYVSAFPEKQWTISTRQLMGHVAGIDRDPMPRGCSDVDDALAIFKDDPLAFRPGSEYRYSVYGWILVSAIVEGAASTLR